MALRTYLIMMLFLLLYCICYCFVVHELIVVLLLLRIVDLSDVVAAAIALNINSIL